MMIDSDNREALGIILEAQSAMLQRLDRIEARLALLGPMRSAPHYLDWIEAQRLAMKSICERDNADADLAQRR